MKEEDKLLTSLQLSHASNGLPIKTDGADMCTGDTESKHDNEGFKEASKQRKAVVLAACIFLQVGCIGMESALGVIYVELIDYFETSRTESALVESMYIGFVVGGGILFTHVVLRYDCGLAIIISSSITATSFCVSAFSPNIQVVIFLIGFIAGLATSVNYLSGYIVVSWTFQKRRKAALVVLQMGPALAQATMPFITTALVGQVLWTGTVVILGAFAFLNCIPCGLIIYYSRDYFQKGDVAKLKSSKLIDRECLTDATFMIFVISYFLLVSFIPVELWFVVDLAVLKGYSVESGATLLSLFGVLNACSRVICTFWLSIAPNTKQERHLIYMFLGLGVGHVMVSEATVYWVMVLGIILRGLSGGLMSSFLLGVQIDIRGLELFPQTTSICNFLGGIGLIGGGFVGGLTYDITGSYRFVFFLAAGMNVFNAASMVMIIILQKYKRTRTRGYETL